MTSRKNLVSMLAALALAASPLLVAETAASAQVAPVAEDGLKLTAPGLFTATAGTWVPVRAKIKNTSSKAATVTLTVKPSRGTQVSARSVSVGKIAPGAVKVAIVRIQARQGQASATLKAVSAKASSEAATVSIVAGGVTL